MKKFIHQFILVTIAIFLIGVAVNMFLGPHQIAAGGVSGIGILAEKAFGLDRATVVFALNTVLLVFAFIFLGKRIFLRTVIGSNMLPLALAIIPEIKLASDPLVSVIFGSVIFAVGVVLLYQNDASSGGTTIPPLIFKKYFNLSPSLGLLFTDAVIVVFNIFVFSFDSFLFAILSIVITSMVMSYAENGLDRKKAITIISDESDAIASAIMTEIQRGVTSIKTRGEFTKKENDMLFVVVDRKDYRDVKIIIDRFDKKAFVVVSPVTDVHGLGFSYHSIE